MITEVQATVLCAGGRTLSITKGDTGLWTICRKCTSPFHKGHKAQTASSYSLDVAVTRLIERTERDLLDATSEGRAA